MNLNIGASNVDSYYRTSEWVNLDLFPFKGVDVLGSGIALPFKDNSFEKIHCVHVLEHVTRDKYFPMLQEMQRVLIPGGRAFVEVPDFQNIISTLNEAFQLQDTKLIHNTTTSIYGKNEREGMAHYWGFTEALLIFKMKEAGFSSVMRQTTAMISAHFKQEPVILMIGRK